MTAPNAFSLEAVTEAVMDRPPRIIIHGPEGVGKTTFGVQFWNAILLMTEDGVGSLRVKRFPNVAQSFAEVTAALSSLFYQKHDRVTLVFDSLDWFEPLVWAEACRRKGIKNIEDLDYGKGYVLADEVWAEFFRMLVALNTQKGMCIVMTAHSAITRVTSPMSEPFDRYTLKVHKRAAALAQEWADVIGFAHWQQSVMATDMGFNKKAARGVSNGGRLLALENRPAYVAKNRYQLPALMELNAPQFMALLSQRYEPAPIIEAVDTNNQQGSAQ